MGANYLRQWNEVNIGGDYEIGRSVRRCVRVSVYTMTKQKRWRRLVKTSTLAEICTLTRAFYTVSQKNIPDIFNCNLKTDYQIFIIFGTNIPDTTCHQMTI